MSKTADRFWNKVDPTPTCWLWTRATNIQGYGRFWDGEKLVGAHRFSWELHNGSIPVGLFVLHQCDVPSCVNPDHLFLGTHRDNSQDKLNKNREAKGEMNGHAILAKEDVLSIRASKLSQRTLARRYGVDQSTISLVVNHKRWKHI